MTRLNIKVGMQVAFNTLPDAAWFDVIDISRDGQILTIREQGADYASQRWYACAVAQIRN